MEPFMCINFIPACPQSLLKQQQLKAKGKPKKQKKFRQLFELVPGSCSDWELPTNCDAPRNIWSVINILWE